MNILFPLDEELFAGAQSRFVQSHRFPSNVTVRLLHVFNSFKVDKSDIDKEQYIQQLVVEARKNIDRIMSNIDGELKKYDPSLKIEKVIKEGDATEVILDEARDWPANLIVLGSHGRRGMNRMMPGSISFSVLSNSPCDAIVIGLPKSARAAAITGKKLSLEINIH